MSVFIFLLALACYSETIHLEGLTIDKGQNSVVFDGKNLKDIPKKIDVTDLGDLISRSFWGQRMKKETPISLDHTKIPEANLLVVNFDAEPIKELIGKESILDYNFFPADHVSLLTSLVTSKNPNVHGVVSRKWYVDEKPVDAFTVPNSFSSSLSFPELVQHVHPETKVISSSSDPQLATAFVQNTFPIDSVKTDTGFQSAHGLGFTDEELVSSIQNHEFWKDIKTHVEKMDQSNPEVKSFLKDIEYIRRLHANMKENKQPTLYNVATKTPANTPQAAPILKHALLKLMHAFKHAHPEGSSQIVFLNEPEIVKNEAKETTIPHHHPVEFSEVCEDCANNAGGKSYQVIADSRGYQIAIWFIFFSIFFLYMYIDSMAFMDYAKDATLFTTWVKGTKPSGRGMASGDMRAFNIRS